MEHLPNYTGSNTGGMTFDSC